MIDTATLQYRIADALRTVREAAPAALDAVAADPLGQDGRDTISALGDRRLGAVIDAWVNAYTEYVVAAQGLATLAADDNLRAGRHQRIFEAGVRWRSEVLARRRNALVAATRTAVRALERHAS